MSSHTLYTSLLRPPILHILRAAGFHSARQTAIDNLVDLAARYLMLLASTTASHAFNNRNDLTPTITDVRMALQDVGALSPQKSAMEEQYEGEEDLRGVEAFVDWVQGDVNREIRRIAGLDREEGAVGLDAGDEREDFLTALKKKHSKTGEESRYQGTVLGKTADERIIKIEGGPIESIQAWENKLREQPQKLLLSPMLLNPSPEAMTSESSPLSEI